MWDATAIKPSHDGRLIVGVTIADAGPYPKHAVATRVKRKRGSPRPPE
jgi:hypothetical protein